MSTVEIFVMTHKQFQRKLPGGYTPLHVGAALGNDLGYLRDDTGDNISIKNRQYCELTGLYWMWKNSQADVVGLCHYRRYFSKRPLDRNLHAILKIEDIDHLLKNHDIILPFPVVGAKSNGEIYRTEHIENDYDLTRAAIETVSPDYCETFDRVMAKHSCCQCNMFIARRETMAQYCQWLFSVYDELEKHVDFMGYDAYQKRMFGFMSERLLNVWVEHQQLKKAYAFMASTEIDYVKALKDKIGEYIHR